MNYFKFPEFIKKPRQFLAGMLLVLFLSFIFSAAVFADWDGQVYAPGATLNPECAPGIANCTVSLILGGDVIGPASSTVVGNDSHSHTGATIFDLSAANFATTAISQWTNDLNYITDGNTSWNNEYGFITGLNFSQVANGSGIYLDYRPNNTACAANQILKYSEGTGWVCGNDTEATLPGGSNRQIQFNNGGVFRGSLLEYNINQEPNRAVLLTPSATVDGNGVDFALSTGVGGSNTGSGGSISFNAGNSQAYGYGGGSIRFTSGSGSTYSQGGYFLIDSGDGRELGLGGGLVFVGGDGGRNYGSGGSISFTAGSAQGGTGAIATVSVDTSGTGYTVGNVLTLSKGNANAIVTVTFVDLGDLATVSPNALGSGYTASDQLTVMGGNNDAVLNVNSVDGSGGITGLSIVTPGTGYATGNRFALSGGTGDQAATVDITTTITAGAVGGITLTTIGTGYTVGTSTVTGGTGNNDAVISINTLAGAGDAGGGISLTAGAGNLTNGPGGSVTITAGNARAGDSDGGSVILSSGLGKGTGASSIIFQTGRTLTTGSTLQTLTTAMTILGSGNVGIGTTEPRSILDLGDANLGNEASGRILTIGRNTNTTTTSAGAVNFLSKAGTNGYAWQDAAGNMRISTSSVPTNTGDTGGIVIGTQTSGRDTKQDIRDYTSYNDALQMVVSAPLHYFRYKNEVAGYGSDNSLAKERIGFISDEVNSVFMWGNAIDQVSVNGILMASIKAQQEQIGDLKLELDNSGLINASSTDEMGQGGGFVEMIRNALSYLGMTLQNGIASLKEMTVDRMFAKKAIMDVAKMKEMEMVDKSTGDVYCTWITNGEWVKIKGECGELAVPAKSNAKSIVTFELANSVAAKIDETNRAISLTMPSGTDVTVLAPTITVSENATTTPATGEAQNFTNSVTYTVTAQDGTAQDYVVTVTVVASEPVVPAVEKVDEPVGEAPTE